MAPLSLFLVYFFSSTMFYKPSDSSPSHRFLWSVSKKNRHLTYSPLSSVCCAQFIALEQDDSADNSTTAQGSMNGDILTLKHLTATIGSISQTQSRGRGPTQHPLRLREYPLPHCSGLPLSGYLLPFKRKMTRPSQTCHCNTGGDFVAANLQDVMMAGGRGGSLLAGTSSTPPMEATRSGQWVKWREIGGVVVFCSLSQWLRQLLSPSGCEAGLLK